MPKSKKVEKVVDIKKKKSVSKKVKSPDKVKPVQTKENKKPKEEKTQKPVQTKEEKTQNPVQTKENKKPSSPRKRANSLELFDKYGYDIYTEDEKRYEALGNLVIVFGPSELIKKLDSESMKTPNMANKFNNDKRWVRDNFKK